MFIWNNGLNIMGNAVLAIGFITLMAFSGGYCKTWAKQKGIKRGFLLIAFIVLVVVMGSSGWILLLRYGLNTYSLSSWVLIYILYLLGVHDLFEKVIPKNILLMSFALGILLGFFNPNLHKLDMVLSPIIIIVGMGLLSKILKGGIGQGDILVIAWTSLMIGYQGALSILLLAIIFAGVLACILWSLKKVKLSTKIPFVPFVFGAAYFVSCI